MTFNKRNVILLLAGIIAGAALMWWWSRQPTKPNVAIRDGETIDFSSGKPVVKKSAHEKAIIDAAVKEMDEAAKSVTFGPTTPPVKIDQKKNAETPAAPPPR